MDEEKTELHPVVDLLLRRAESHPEEIFNGRWDWVINEILNSGSPEEVAVVIPVVKKTKLNETHRHFMRELLNPVQPDLLGVGLGGQYNPYPTTHTQRHNKCHNNNNNNY